jgi:hypothetical protein
MKPLLAVLAVTLIAATPQEALPELEANGYYIEQDSAASEQVVSDAVFDGRADGGRLYIVVLAEEPPGGATTFSDSALDLLDGEGYVLTVAPETVGYAGDGTSWTDSEMDGAVDASLDGGSDDEVVQLFAASLTGAFPVDGGGDDPEDGASAGGGISLMWILLIGGAAVGIWVFLSRRSRAKRVAGRMEGVRELAKQKLDEVANDILDMEDEVAMSENPEIKQHYQRASSMYAKAMDDTTRASTIREMLEVSEELDMAIWELDCTEALLDGKPKPAKPEPKTEVLAPAPPPDVPDGHGLPANVPGTVDQFDRRSQRQSSGTEDILTMLMTMMAMGGMRGPGGGFGGGFGGGGRGPSMGGRGRIRGGGRRRG